jgi:hypothetical protein
MDCFIDPFGRPADAVLAQTRGLLIADRVCA